MHALKLYGPRTGGQNSYGAARAPHGPREWTYDFCSKQPGNNPYGARECDVTGASHVLIAQGNWKLRGAMWDTFIFVHKIPFCWVWNNYVNKECILSQQKVETKFILYRRNGFCLHEIVHTEFILSRQNGSRINRIHFVETQWILSTELCWYTSARCPHFTQPRCMYSKPVQCVEWQGRIMYSEYDSCSDKSPSNRHLTDLKILEKRTFPTYEYWLS